MILLVCTNVKEQAHLAFASTWLCSFIILTNRIIYLLIGVELITDVVSVAEVT